MAARNLGDGEAGGGGAAAGAGGDCPRGGGGGGVDAPSGEGQMAGNSFLPARPSAAQSDAPELWTELSPEMRAATAFARAVLTSPAKSSHRWASSFGAIE
jgi:hypothetical protein